MYLCFVKFYIKFGVFHILGHGPARSTIGPRAFRAGPTRKSAHGPCLAVKQARWAVQARPGGTRAIRARALSGRASHGPVPGRAGPARCSSLMRSLSVATSLVKQLSILIF